MTSKLVRTYSELILLPTFEERFAYLKLDGTVGYSTFGYDRFLNQDFYNRSKEWKVARDIVIARDLGCDLGIDGYVIHGRIIVHHMNPIFAEDIKHASDFLCDPEYLITTSAMPTHNAIHYGHADMLPRAPIQRTPNDTCPWRQ